MKINKFIIAILTIGFSFQMQAQVKEITILHTNDMHAHLEGGSPAIAYSPEVINNDQTTGGFARVAGIIDDVKASSPNVFVFDAGDFLMGTLFQAVEMNTGFELNLMKKMGYDAVTLGNHEFDFGVNTFAKYVELAQARPDGIPTLVNANIVCDPKDTRDDELQKLYDNGTIKSYTVIERDGIRIGVFGILGKDAYEDTNEESLTIDDPIKTAKKIVKKLRDKEKVDLVVMLSHSGVFYNTNGELENREDVKVAKKVKGIDVIISGHTHTKLSQPYNINGTLIVQTGCFAKYVGKLTLDYDESTGKVTMKNYELIPVDDKIMGNKAINNDINAQKQVLDTLLNKIGYSYNEKVFESDYPLYRSENYDSSRIGNFIADAMYYNINKHVQGGVNIAMIGQGLIRGNLNQGTVYLPEVFESASLGIGKDAVPGYSLARAYLTGKELKKIFSLLITFSSKKSDFYCYVSGLKIDYNPNKGLLKKVQKLSLLQSDGSYKTMNDDQLYSIAADTYMVSFIGKIKKMTLGLVKIVPKDKDGHKITDMSKTVCDFDAAKAGVQPSKIWTSIIEYSKSFKDTDGDGVPNLPEKYKTPEERYIVVK